MQKLFSFTCLLLGSTLLLMVAVVVMIPQDSMGVAELWALIKSDGDYADGLSLLNQQTGRESELVHGHVGSVIGVARDGSAILYTD
jgi:hypothetical protein